ncbi:MAG: hypothetical protein H6825_08715 [Planctomycetes bacterium]|nr:hypothetical protein [Planctomycetota bacterium]
MRERALAVLVSVDGGAFASERLLPSDPPFVRELVLGVLRRRLTLDAIYAAFGRRPLEDLDVDVRSAIRAGLYQLHFMDGIPPHAAVAETVGTLRLASRRAYVNAVLRAIQRESRRVPPAADRGGAHPSKRLEREGRSVSFFSRRVFPDPAEDRVGWLSVLHSHPRLLVERWLAQVGEDEAVRRMQAGNATPPLVLRPCAPRVDALELARRLDAEGVSVRLVERESGRHAVSAPPGARKLFSTRAFREGLFSVQDAAQMDAVELLAPDPDAVVWDVCAAPGGKTTQIAEQLASGRGRIVATDLVPDRLRKVEENLARLGLAERVVTAAHDALSDAPPPHMPSGGFDAVLLDAPCSNTAVLARRPEARWRLTAATFDEMGALQARMLRSVRRWVRPGGRLVYSVCTYEPEEGAAHALAPTRSPFAWLDAPQERAP